MHLLGRCASFLSNLVSKLQDSAERYLIFVMEPVPEQRLI